MLRYASQANWQGYWPGRMKAQDRGPYSEKEAEIARLKRLHRRLGGETIDVKGYRFRKAADREGAAGNPSCLVCLQKDRLLFETTDTQLSGRPLRRPSCSAFYSNVPNFTD